MRIIISRLSAVLMCSSFAHLVKREQILNATLVFSLLPVAIMVPVAIICAHE